MASNFYLKKDESSAAGSRLRPKLTRFEDVNFRMAEVCPSFQSCFTWSFYEAKDSYMLSPEIVARHVEQTSHGVPFFYIARKNRQGQPTVVKYSSFEAGKLVRFIGEILDQINRYPMPESGEETLIPLLAATPGNAYDRPEEMKAAFWDSAHLKLQSVRAKLVFNNIHGSYLLYINSPITDTLAQKYKGWCGSIIPLNLTAMKAMEAFLIEHLEVKEDKSSAGQDETSAEKMQL